MFPSLRYACVIRPLPLSPINCVLTECRPPPSRNIRSMHVTCVGRKRERKKSITRFPHVRMYAYTHPAIANQSPGLFTHVALHPRTYLAPVPRTIAYRSQQLCYFYFHARYSSREGTIAIITEDRKTKNADIEKAGALCFTCDFFISQFFVKEKREK